MSDQSYAAERYLRLIGRPDNDGYKILNRGALESTIVSEGSMQLFENDASAKLARLEDRLNFEAENWNNERFDELDIRRRAIVKGAKVGLAKLSQDGPDAKLTDDEAAGLEAIVESDGSRPSFRIHEGHIDSNGVAVGEWDYVLNHHSDKIIGAASSVGRIDLNGKPMGTGFVVDDGVILTNRHVLQLIANFDSVTKSWHSKGEVTIDFGDGTEQNDTLEFKLQMDGAAFGEHSIEGQVDFSRLDYAFLRCEIPKGRNFPDPLVPETATSYLFPTRPIYSIGYPGRPRAGEYPVQILIELFNYVFGVKRFSPGVVDLSPGTIKADDLNSVFQYDATTLGGSSGSPVIDVDANGAKVVGLHFAGLQAEANYAHSIAVIRENMEKRGGRFALSNLLQ